MKKLVTILVVYFFATNSLQAWEALSTDVTQQEFAEHKSGLDHLEPVSVKEPHSYYIAQYVVYPSFTPAKRLLVLQNKENEKYYVKVWNEYKPGDTDENIPASITVEIPEEIASLIYEIWVNELLEVRYSRYSSLGCDGTTYVFSTYVRALGWMHGSTWSPRLDLPPRWIVEAGDLLFQLTKQNNNNYESSKKKLIKIRTRLLTYLEKNGKH